MLFQIRNHPLMKQQNNSEPWIQIDTGYSYHSIEDMALHAQQLDCNLVMNCTGLGSWNICKDSSIQGGRGILLHYDRRKCHRRVGHEQPNQDVAIFVQDLPWATSNEACYLIPRGDVLLVGGSFDLMEPQMEEEKRMESKEKQRLLQNAKRMGVDSTLSDPIDEWIGYRPWRPTVRVEVEYVQGIPLIHNYGHGGSGWTVYVGAVQEAVSLAIKSTQ